MKMYPNTRKTINNLVRSEVSTMDSKLAPFASIGEAESVIRGGFERVKKQLVDLGISTDFFSNGVWEELDGELCEDLEQVKNDAVLLAAYATTLAGVVERTLDTFYPAKGSKMTQKEYEQFFEEGGEERKNEDS